MTGGAALDLPGNNSNGDDGSRWAGIARIRGPRAAHLPTITLGLLGVQIFWSVETSYAPPYLLSLGLSKSYMALVFVAGPLSGLIMQPLIGILADNSKSRFGRRRPYLIAGCVFCVFSMLLLGFTRSFSNIFTPKDTHSNDILTIWLAVVAIYFIDFAINAVQAMDRALLVDTLSASDQASGNAWAARMLGTGSVIGFLLWVGSINLPAIFPFLGSLQLQALAVLASMLLFFSHAITAYFVDERILLSSNHRRRSFVSEMREMFGYMSTLPSTIRQICFIQFFAWIGWFPILFYTTTYIGDIHKANSPLPSNHEAAVALDAEATRLGSRAMLYNSLISFACNFALPLFVAESNGTARVMPHWLRGFKIHLASLWAASHVIFALCMGATLFVSDVGGSTFLISILGVSWAVTQWAPFSLLGEAILTEPTTDDTTSIMLEDTRRRSNVFFSADEEERQNLVNGQDDDDNEPTKSLPRSPLLRNSHARSSSIDITTTNGHGELAGNFGHSSGGLSAKAGVILGIHNIFIVLPQFIVTGISSIIFAILDPAQSTLPAEHGADAVEQARAEPTKSGFNAVGIVFRLGGISTAIAFVLCWRLARQLRHR